MQGVDVRTFAWDAAGRLVQATVFTLTTHFTYAGDGTRVAVEVEGQGTTAYVTDQGGRILVESTATTSTRYLYGRECLGEVRDGVLLYYLSDGAGYVRQSADAAGEVQDAWIYTPDGGVMAGPQGPVSHLVCGGVYDWSTGLIHKGGRYFDPALGIWLALGPLVVVQSWRRQRKKGRKAGGFPWYVVLLVVGVGTTGMLTACAPCEECQTPTPPPICTLLPTLPPTLPPTPTPSLGTAYITIDDGPGGFTSQVLDVLSRYQVKATFFVVGDRIADWPDEVRRMRNEGHAIGLHSWDHPTPWAGLSPDEQEDQVRRTQEELIGVLGQGSNLFRSPGGDPSAGPGGSVPGYPDLYNYYWTVDSKDWALDAASNADRVAQIVFQGDTDWPDTIPVAIDTALWRRPVILIHSIHPVDPPALELIIQGLRERRYGFDVLPRPGDSPGPMIYPQD
jgi:peptidoglycan/xylan/chitin deacetylase (PgdA/CDA1 family)